MHINYIKNVMKFYYLNLKKLLFSIIPQEINYVILMKQIYQFFQLLHYV